MVVLNAEIMPKFEGKSAKSVDSTFKLFGRTIAVKNSCDNSSSSIHVDGIPAEAANSAVSKASETRHDEKQKQNEDSEKLGKKPTKPVPCPRCESMDTKFCYFNNYNVNQPRHYCRRCQRYWTAGGSLRNVPVGAGRRKNKPCFGIQHRQIMEDSEILWNDGQSQTSGRNSDKLVKVEPFYPEFDNFREGLNEAATPTEGNPKPQPQIQSQFDDYSYPSTVNLSSDKVGKELLLGSGNEVGSMRWPANSAHLTKEPANSTHLIKELESAQKPSCSSEKTQRSATKAESAEPVDDLACDSNPKSEIKNMSPDGSSSSSSSSMNFMGNPWPVYYNGSWGSFPPGMEGSETNRVPWYPPGTGLLPSVSWPLPSAVMWGIPWMPGNASSESKTLGKHQREETTQAVSENKSRSLWVPKTLRMDDREEAARSSFLTNLGLENKEGSINSAGILKGFQSKMDNTESTKAAPVQILCANPAALSRSSSFLESS